MNECTVLVLNEKLKAGNAQVVDVRDYAEYANGHAAGAKSFPLADLERRSGELDHAQPVYVMCRTGRRYAAGREKLKALGFADAVNVAGGFEAWKKENLPVEKDEKAPWSLERQVRFAAGLLVLTGVLASVFVHPYSLLLAGLAGTGLVLAAATDTCLMGMLLAKMPWNKTGAACDCGCESAERNTPVVGIQSRGSS